MRRSQVTLFLILAFVIVVGAFFVVSLRSGSSDANIRPVLEAPAELQPLKSFVEACLSSTLKDAVSFVSLQGGFYDTPLPSAQFMFARIPYYWDYGYGEHVPAKETVESQISLYVSELLPICLDDFATFKNLGFQVDCSDPVVVAVVSEKSVFCDIQMLVRISKDSFSFSVNEFSASVDSILSDMHGHASDITDAISSKPGFLPLSHMVVLGIKNGFTIEVLYQENGSVIMSLIDDRERLPQIYAFAVNYSWYLGDSGSVSILPIPDQTAAADYVFGYDVDAVPEKVTFYDYTGLFDINDSTGLVEFVPGQDDSGLHRIIIKARNDKGRQDSRIMNLHITAENKAPVVQPISNKFLAVGEGLSYQVQAFDDDALFYSADTDLADFTIGLSTGLISYNAADAGTHSVTVIVVDIKGSVATETFEVTVHE
ncbi:MAG: Ig domain-containing protein [Candidatus Woesearchaeota archaeon]